MWTFKILKKQRTSPTSIEVIVEFTKDTTSHTKIFQLDNNLSREWLEAQIKNEVARLDSADSLEAELTVGSFVLTEPEVIVPTKEELDREELRIKLQELQEQVKLVEAGVIDAVDPTLKSRISELYNLKSIAAEPVEAPR